MQETKINSNAELQLSSRLNYSEKLFLSRSIDRKTKIDIAFNSISDTNNQQQITSALKQMTEVNERKELISKIIRRKKEIQKMKEINTINSLAPLFAKIKHKFFNNLYKKTGNPQYLQLSQGKSTNQEEEGSATLRQQNDSEDENKQDEEEQNKQNDSLYPNQTPQTNTLVNTPLLDQLKIIKKQHLFNALTLLATTRSDSKRKAKVNQSQLGRFSHQDSGYLQFQDSKLQYLTKDPNIFKAEIQFNKEYKKQNEQNTLVEGQEQKVEGGVEKANKGKQLSEKVKSKVDHRNLHTQFKNQIITNHTSLQNILEYQSLQTRDKPIQNQFSSTISDSNNTKLKQSNQFIDQNNKNKQKYNFQIDKAESNKQNSILERMTQKSQENSFFIQDYLSEDKEEGERKSDSNEISIIGSNRQSTLKKKRPSFLEKKFINEDEENRFIKGLPKVNNFGGHYYYLGKEIPQSNLYRFIVQCEQKRMYQKSDGNLFSNKPFTQNLDSLNQISHIHKIVDSDTKLVNIFKLKHYPASCTLRQPKLFHKKVDSSSALTQNSSKGLPSLYTSSSLFQKKQTDTSGNNSSKAKSYLNNTKDTDSIFSTQMPDNLKSHIIKGYYSPKSQTNSVNQSWKKQYFVKINNKKI